MKKLSLLAGVIVLSMVLFACNQTPKTTEETPEPEKTIKNLMNAIIGESNASAKYAVFSKAAEEAGMLNIAKMFAAAAEAEKIHIANHNVVLKGLFDSEFNLEVEEHIADKDMLKNLEDAIAGETHEFTEMYPEFIEDANAENVSDAVKTFEHALKAEKGHAKHYQDALDILKSTGNDEGVSSEWYVCPICGELTPTIEGMKNCSICGEKVEKFNKF